MIEPRKPRLRFNADRAWRWVLRLSGLVGIFIGANSKPPWPSIAFVVFAAMIGLDQFIERIKVNGKDGDRR